jgi:hypothetical protein
MPTLRASTAFLTKFAASAANYGHAPWLTAKLIGVPTSPGSPTGAPTAGFSVVVPPVLGLQSSATSGANYPLAVPVINAGSQVVTVQNMQSGSNYAPESLLFHLVLQSGRVVNCNADFVTNSQQTDVAQELADLGWSFYAPAGTYALPIPLS